MERLVLPFSVFVCPRAAFPPPRARTALARPFWPTGLLAEESRAAVRREIAPTRAARASLERSSVSVGFPEARVFDLFVTRDLVSPPPGAERFSPRPTIARKLSGCPSVFLRITAVLQRRPSKTHRGAKYLSCARSFRSTHATCDTRIDVCPCTNATKTSDHTGQRGRVHCTL